MSVRKGEAAVHNASTWVGHSYPAGWCLRWVRERFGIGLLYGSAALAWRSAKHRHQSGPPPRGVPVFYTGGRSGFGHVAISAGGGYIYTTDLPNMGRVGKVHWKEPIRRWGMTYAGWTNDLNGVSTWCRTVDLSRLRYAAKDHPMHYQYGTFAVQRQLAMVGLLPWAKVNGWWGTSTTKAYAAWQQRLGYSRMEADGIPGLTTLRHLGQHSPFIIAKS